MPLYSYTVALFRYMNEAGNVVFFLFDLYCMNSCRIANGELGFLVLIKLDSSFQIDRYIKEAYQLSGKVHPPYFQSQFISVNINATESSQINYFKGMKRWQTKAKKNLQKKQDTQCKKNFLMAKMPANFKCSSRIKTLKNLIGFVQSQGQEN